MNLSNMIHEDRIVKIGDTVNSTSNHSSIAVMLDQ